MSGQGMRPGQALTLAVRDFYGNSWRLVPVNAALGAVLLMRVDSGWARVGIGVCLAISGVSVFFTRTLVFTGSYPARIVRAASRITERRRHHWGWP